METKMKIFWTDDFSGHYPVGTAAIVIEKNELAARIRLDNEIKSIGLDGLRPNAVLHKIPQTNPVAIIIRDGNY